MRPKFSVCLTDLNRFNVDQRFASELESSGLFSLFLPENSHVPLNRPGTLKRFEDIKRLAYFYDPYISLAALSSLTDTIKLGTSVCLLTQRNPLLVARSIWSLQKVSGNRFIMGIAGGFIREAMENYGADFSERWNIVEESVSIIRSQWDGGSLGDPGVAQPPIWIGSNSKEVPKRVARYADGWMTRKNLYPANAIEDMREACAEIGRPFSSVTMALMDASLEVGQIESDFEAGYQHFLYFLPGDGKIEGFKKLEFITKLIDHFD